MFVGIFLLLLSFVIMVYMWRSPYFVRVYSLFVFFEFRCFFLLLLLLLFSILFIFVFLLAFSSKHTSKYLSSLRCCCMVFRMYACECVSIWAVEIAAHIKESQEVQENIGRTIENWTYTQTNTYTHTHTQSLISIVYCIAWPKCYFVVVEQNIKRWYYEQILIRYTTIHRKAFIHTHTYSMHNGTNTHGVPDHIRTCTHTHGTQSHWHY